MLIVKRKKQKTKCYKFKVHYIIINIISPVLVGLEEVSHSIDSSVRENENGLIFLLHVRTKQTFF